MRTHLILGIGGLVITLCLVVIVESISGDNQMFRFCFALGIATGAFLIIGSNLIGEWIEKRKNPEVME